MAQGSPCAMLCMSSSSIVGGASAACQRRSPRHSPQSAELQRKVRHHASRARHNSSATTRSHSLGDHPTARHRPLRASKIEARNSRKLTGTSFPNPPPTSCNTRQDEDHRRAPSRQLAPLLQARAERSTSAAAAARAADAGAAATSTAAALDGPDSSEGEAPTVYDAIVVGSGIGGLVAATQLAVRGAKVLLLEKYLIPGGSSGFYRKEGYTFDVGSSVMFGFGDKGNVNLITRALAAVGKQLPLIPDPTTVHYHLPDKLSVLVPRDYDEFIKELAGKFPHEEEGIRKFFGECWTVFNALNALELKSLEEPLYLLGQFFRNPLACLTLAYYLPQNAGDIARKHIKDKNLLSYIDAECFIVSTVDALNTPMINAAMVLCDRHFGGINYPAGGVGQIPLALLEGLRERGGEARFAANVKEIVVEGGRAAGVRLASGEVIRSKTIVSNATRWDTFGNLLSQQPLPAEEAAFQQRYKKSPSFLSIYMGVHSAVLPAGTHCHHLLLEDDWSRLEQPYATIFLSIPTILDPSLAPPDRHILHIFTTAWMDDWKGLERAAYEEKKQKIADKIVERLERELFPNLKNAIDFMEVGTPRTHRRFLARTDGTYGPIPNRRPLGLLGMPFNSTSVDGLYCVGDSCFPGQGVIAVAFSGIMCGHRVAADLGLEDSNPTLDKGLKGLLSWFRSLA